MMYCQVTNCRYRFSHTTSGHKCGKCQNYGHGIIECSNDELFNNLKQFHSDIMPKSEQCTVSICKHRDSHSIEAHFCKKCNGRHSIDQCKLYRMMPLCVIDEARKIMNTINGKIYVKLWIGMGQYGYYKRDDVGMIVTSTSCNYDEDNSNEINTFIDGYRQICV